MPKIRFIKVRCVHCDAEYKVRLKRVEEGQPFECLACGERVTVLQYADLLGLSLRYSEAVAEIESRAAVDGDVLVPKRAASSLVG